MPPDPLVSRDFVAPNGRSRAHIANILNYATPGLTNKKRLGTPLQMKATMPAITINAPLQPSASMESARIGLIVKVPAPGPEAIIPVAKERRLRKYFGTITNTAV